MVRNERSLNEIRAVVGNEGPPARLRSGDVVRVEVLDASRPGMARIRIAGSVLLATDSRLFSSGESFRARVTLSSGAILLSPLPESAPDAAADSGPLARIGLPETPVTVFLANFFRTVNARLDPALLRSLSAIAAKFPGREKRAAEAAAILAERGIEPDEEAVARLVACIEGEGADCGEAGIAPGDSGGSDHADGADGADGADCARSADSGENDADSSPDGPFDETGAVAPRATFADDASAASRSGRLRSFLSFVNAKRGGEFHWVVVPFDLALSGRQCRGSVRFLLDLSTHEVLQTRIACLDGLRDWDFILGEGECAFNAEPGFDGPAGKTVAGLLARSLARAGIRSVEMRADLDRGGDLPRVDVRA